MTQKELNYVEDAIEHEKNIISICEDILEGIEDEDIIEFIEDNIEEHTSMKERLMNLLEEKVNG